MTAHAFFDLVPAVLHWIAILSVLTVSVMNVIVSRSRIGVAVGLCWVILGFVFIVLLAPRWNEGVQVFEYLLLTYFALQNVRQLMGWGTQQDPYESNRRLARAAFGPALAERLFAPVDRTRARQRKAKERGMTLVQLMREEQTERHRRTRR